MVGLIAWEVIIYSPPLQDSQGKLSVTVKSVRAGTGSTTADVFIGHGSTNQVLRLAAFPLRDKPVRQLDVFVFVDSTYPTAGVGYTSVQGVFDHLGGELAVRGYAARVSSITGIGLKDVLAATDLAGQRAVVIMTGVMPTTVFSSSTDLISPWVAAGGLLIWGGGTIGYWTAAPGQTLANRNVLGERGTTRLVGAGVIMYPWEEGRVADHEGDFADALGISYRLANAGVLHDPVLARAGLDLGWDAGSYMSVSYLPRGMGGYLIFGGKILDEESVAKDLAQIILSNSLDAIGPVATQVVTLTRTTPNHVLHWQVPFIAPKAGIMLVAFESDSDATYFHSEVIGGN